jgi:hypothetical protein
MKIYRTVVKNNLKNGCSPINTGATSYQNNSRRSTILDCQLLHLILMVGDLKNRVQTYFRVAR